MSEGDRKETVMVDTPIALQCETSKPTEPTEQVSRVEGGTQLLPQSEVDFPSEESLRTLVVPSVTQTHVDEQRCELHSSDAEFAVRVEGNAQTLPCAFAALRWRLTAESVGLTVSFFLITLTKFSKM